MAPGMGGSEWHPVQLAASIEATSQGTPVAAATPPSPEVPRPLPELPELPELDDVPGPGDVPEPEAETPPVALPAFDEDPDETGAGAPGTTMTCGSDAELPHPLEETHRHALARTVKTLARWAVTGLDMGMGAALHCSDQANRARMDGHSRGHPLAGAITVIKTITPPRVVDQGIQGSPQPALASPSLICICAGPATLS